MNHHRSRWVWELWWHTHARGIIYRDPSKGLLWQKCCCREDQLWILLDQSSESDHSLGPRLQEDQSDTINNWHQQCCLIQHCNWSGKTEGQDQEAQSRGICQPQQGRQSRQDKTAQGLDHMVPGTQELPVNQSWSGRISPHLCDKGVCVTRLCHRVATRLQLWTVVN